MMEKDNEELCVQQWRLITQKPNILLGERERDSISKFNYFSGTKADIN